MEPIFFCHARHRRTSRGLGLHLPSSELWRNPLFFGQIFGKDKVIFQFMKNFLGEEERNPPENIPYTYDARSVTGPQRIAVTSVYSTFPYKIYMFTSITNTVNHRLLRLGRQVAGFKTEFHGTLSHYLSPLTSRFLLAKNLHLHFPLFSPQATTTIRRHSHAIYSWLLTPPDKHYRHVRNNFLISLFF